MTATAESGTDLEPTSDSDVAQQAPPDVDPSDTLPAARPPRGTGPAPTVAVLLSLVLIALGVVGIRDALVGWGALSGTPWTKSLAGVTGAVTAKPWMVVVSVALVLLALLLVLAALRPRPRRGLMLAGATGIYIRHRDLQRLLKQAAGDAAGVRSVDVTAKSPRRVRMRVASTASEQEISGVEQAVRGKIEPIVGALRKQPRVDVTVTPFEEGRS